MNRDQSWVDTCMISAQSNTWHEGWYFCTSKSWLFQINFHKHEKEIFGPNGDRMRGNDGFCTENKDHRPKKTSEISLSHWLSELQTTNPLGRYAISANGQLRDKRIGHLSTDEFAKTILQIPRNIAIRCRDVSHERTAIQRASGWRS